MFNMLKVFRNLLVPRVAAAPPRPKPPPSIKPMLEWLEERRLLNATTDTLIWNPTVDDHASNFANWYDATQQQQGVIAPTATNPIVLDGSQLSHNQPIVFNQAMSCGSITVQNNYANTVTINNNSTLTNTGNDVINSGCTLTLVSYDSQGILLDSGNTFSVQGGGTLKLVDPPQATAGSTFFSSNTNLAEYISNGGTVTWNGTAVASGNSALNDTIGAPVLNTGTFTVDGGTNGAAGSVGAVLNILNSTISTKSVGFYQTSGSISFQNGALVSSIDGYYQTGGTIKSDSSAGLGLVSGAEGDGDINIAGGNVVVDTVPNTVGTLKFYASTVEMNGQLHVWGLTTGGNSTQSDLLDCGSATVTFGTNCNLTVGTTGTGALGIGNNWTVMKFGSNNGQKDWDFDTVPQGMSQSTDNNKTLVSN